MSLLPKALREKIGIWKANRFLSGSPFSLPSLKMHREAKAKRKAMIEKLRAMGAIVPMKNQSIALPTMPVGSLVTIVNTPAGWQAGTATPRVGPHENDAQPTSKIEGGPLLIGLVGHSGVGKTAIREMLRMEWDFHSVPIAGSIREALAAILNVDCHGAEFKDNTQLGTLTGRDLLISLGQWGREIDQDVWVEAWKSTMDDMPEGNIVVDDVRFAREAAEIRRRGGIIIRVVRPEIDYAMVAKADKLPTEAEIDLIDYDHRLWNARTEESLLEEMRELLGKLGLKKTESVSA